jgi:hypothetical protein
MVGLRVGGGLNEVPLPLPGGSEASISPNGCAGSIVEKCLPGVGGEYFSNSGSGSGGDEPLHHVDDSVVGVNIRRAHGDPVHSQQPILHGVREYKHWPSPETGSTSHRVHRVASPAFWRTFYHEGKISPGW